MFTNWLQEGTVGLGCLESKPKSSRVKRAQRVPQEDT
jgi:hypothetical protein